MNKQPVNSQKERIKEIKKERSKESSKERKKKEEIGVNKTRGACQ